MQPTQRPIHCYNVEDEDFYIKDKDKWQQDNKHHKLNETIDRVTRKQIAQIKEWEKKHPNWNLTEEGNIDYMNMIKTMMGGTTETEIFMNKKLIKKELSETFDIDNASEGLIKSDNNGKNVILENNEVDKNNEINGSTNTVEESEKSINTENKTN